MKEKTSFLIHNSLRFVLNKNHKFLQWILRLEFYLIFLFVITEKTFRYLLQENHVSLPDFAYAGLLQTYFMHKLSFLIEYPQ